MGVGVFRGSLNKDGGQDRNVQLQWIPHLPRPRQEVCPWDQKMFNFITGKTMACQQMKRRNLTTKWTVQYRRINKKGSIEEAEKRRKAKKTTVKTREIVGISDEMLAKKRTARPTTKRSDAQTAAVLSHLKSRKGAKK